MISDDDSVVGGVVDGGGQVSISRFEYNSGAEGDGCARDGANDRGAVAGVAAVLISDDDSVVG